ncbi:hypothetical protein [Nostoc sp. 2RC]|uniref:hypothetical protein n=1 Tax=Nostoc sp. 2RC TaxID=2485484 RepID=UPI001C88E76A|nr:hypothetical protein [Nostoc sp. 2RC]
MSQTTSKVSWTIQDVETLPDNELIRYEILDGELFAVRSPTINISTWDVSFQC